MKLNCLIPNNNFKNKNVIRVKIKIQEYTFSEIAIKKEFSASFVSPSIIPNVLVPLDVIRHISRRTTLSNLVGFFTILKQLQTFITLNKP